MYEAEVSNSIEPIEALPLEVRQRFAEFRMQVAARTTLPWGEHCTECVWPTCYTTCELYEPRKDGACRQFVGGVVRIDHKEGLNPYLLKIRFKQWAKLWTPGNLQLRPLLQAEKKERFNIAVGAIGRASPLPGFAKLRLLQKISHARKLAMTNSPGNGDAPDCFLLECFNPNERTISLTFTLRLRDRNEPRAFQQMINVPKGYTRAKIAFSEIVRAIDISRPFDVEIVPNACDNTVLYFGLIDFVKEFPGKQDVERQPAKSRVFKCIVWDLDNTLWDGTLIEDGPEKIRVRQGVVDAIKETDKRGILHSIASKNNYDDAMKILREHGLAQYFLYPEIKWHPKSQSIAEIARLLNLSTDSLAFVDDQAFEREEVKATLPQVAVIDAVDYASIPDRPECQVPITAESRRRRLMYQEQDQRQTALEVFKGDYSGFLRECRIQVHMESLHEVNLKRVYELAQRTNQMNFSGNRYQEEHLREIMKSPSLETYVIHCQDRFGDYGIVGFAVVDTQVPRLLDLMFSCRVQGKRVEHAILSFLLKKFNSISGRDFFANYRKTDKNAASGKVFEEIGFEPWADNAEIPSLKFSRNRKIPDDEIIQIVTEVG